MVNARARFRVRVGAGTKVGLVSVLGLGEV